MCNEPSGMRTFRYISRTAGRQHGVIRTVQTGATSQTLARAVARGELWPVYRGVYAVGHPKLSREGEWLAAVYAAGDGAGLTGFSGGKFWKISRFPTRDPGRRAEAAPRTGGFQIVPTLLLPGESFVRDAIPVCTVARVLFDMSRELTPEQLANVIHEAEFRKRFNRRAIKRRTKTLDRALELHASGSAGTRSGLEDRFLKLIRGARLPEPVINTHHLGFELDFRWPGLNVEIDGDHHDRARTQRDDRIQDAVLEANGFVVLRFREEHLDRPQEVLRQLAAQDLARGVSR